MPDILVMLSVISSLVMFISVIAIAVNLSWIHNELRGIRKWLEQKEKK